MFCFFFTFEQEHWHRVLSKIDHKVSKSVKFVFILINTTVIDIHSFFVIDFDHERLCQTLNSIQDSC